MGPYQCDRCLKRFSSHYNVRRHKANYCAYANTHSSDDNASMEEERGGSYLDEQSVDSFPDEESVTETEEDENSKNSEDDGEIKENDSEDIKKADPWGVLIHEAASDLGTEYDELVQSFQNDGSGKIDAKKQAFSEILPKFQKELGNVYLDRLQWMSQMKKDPVHKKIMETRKRFVEDNSFDPDEAMDAAIKKRKFLLQHMLEDRQHFHDSDDDDGGDDDTGVHYQLKNELHYH